jgi:TonB family protein
LSPHRRRLAAALTLIAALTVPAGARGQAAPAPQLTKAPKLLKFVSATPPAALAERGQVDVILAIDVDPSGKVQQATVVRSGGADFDEAAVAAARQFLFAPGEAGGKPVAVRVTFRYRFLVKTVAASQPASAPTSRPAGAAGGSTATSQPAAPTVPLGVRVLRKGDRVPVEGVSVYLDDRQDEVTTDARGRVELPAVPVGPHRLRLRGQSIQPVDSEVRLRRGKRLDVTIYVEERERFTTVILGRRPVQDVVEQTLEVEEVRRIPGTQGDTLKAVQNLTGVARAPFGSGLLVVWGSSPEDTRFYVDGVYVPVLYHFAALRSTIPSEMVQSLTFMPGGYGVDHGRGLGGVIEVATRQPRTDGLHGYLQLDLLDGAVGLEGPITRNLSFAASFRRSWIDAFLPLFTSSDFQLTPVYLDYQARLRWKAGPRDDVDVFFFGTDDVLKLALKRPDPSLSAAFNAHTFYHRGTVSWLHRFAGGGTLTVTPAIGYDVPFKLAGTVGNTTFAVAQESFSYTLRALFRKQLDQYFRLEAGLDFEGNRIHASATSPTAGQPREGENPGARGGAFGGAYATDSLVLHSLSTSPFASLIVTTADRRFTFIPQLRVETFGFLGYQGTPDSFTHGYAYFDPRITARYQLLRWLAPKASFGVYHQAPDAFAFSRYFGSTKIQPEWALHYVGGFDLQPTATLSIELQGFYKDLRGLIVHGENPGDPVLVNAGDGRVYGGSLLVRQQLHKNFFGWIAYTISRAERRTHPDQPWQRFQYDQPHILTLVASYKLPRGWQAGLRFRVVSGNPYTPVAGAYFDANQGRYRPIYAAPPYSGRLATFHQLDLRVDKTWTFNRWKLSVYLDVQNLYNAKPPEGITYNFDFTRTASISGLPILPIIGVRGDL